MGKHPPHSGSTQPYPFKTDPPDQTPADLTMATIDWQNPLVGGGSSSASSGWSSSCSTTGSNHFSSSSAPSSSSSDEGDAVTRKQGKKSGKTKTRKQKKIDRSKRPAFTKGARELALQLRIDLSTILPTRGTFVSVQDVQDACRTAPPSGPPTRGSPRKRSAKEPQDHRRIRARHKCPPQDGADSEHGDLLLLDGATIRLEWPCVDRKSHGFNAVVEWAPNGGRRPYMLAFDDGDVRRSRLLGKVPYTAVSSTYSSRHRWSAREVTALKQRHSTEDVASIAISLRRSVGAVKAKAKLLSLCVPARRRSHPG